ncbi:laminin subunit beta-3 isoform X2 [Pyxicephalus adspersus]|uniref:laminin subunit beta-3 isoform X2 n=1 Tax=Pyxicephalus adspersus TaxID=30357 RepID=UPI003B59018C
MTKFGVQSSQEQRMWLVILLFGFLSLSNAQQDCARGACYPAAGDLLIGRTKFLKASSTCGLERPESYCTPFGEGQLKCCRCDSRDPFSSISHRILNVVSPIGHLRWWQSENGVDSVYLQFDTDRKFQLSDVTLDFRSPRPAGMLIERSLDFGRTWQVYQYLAFDCATAFPHILQGRPQNLGDVRCHDLYGNPRHGGKISFSPMAMAFSVPVSKSQQINQLGEFTNLRINFTQLTHLPPLRYREPNAFYAINEMHVHGSCFCYGHGDRCVPGAVPERDPYGDIQVHDTCVCQHNTAGTNCESCADLFNDLPWRPADENNPNVCKKCNCNNHSDKCRFDPAVYEASGRVSGGVCEDCADGTTGTNCERCKPDYYRNPNRDIGHRDACVSCDCDPEGSIAGGSCDQTNGRCICKENVGGERCDQCKPGFYSLSGSNPQGCIKCDCDPQGTATDQPCDSETGQCRCLPNVIGLRCDQCASQYWNIASRRGCQLCDCHPRNSYSLQCNQVTGQCLCREGFGGQRCTECPVRMYGNLQTGCQACNCDFRGTIDIGCDKTTGRCLCQQGVIGTQCDSCERGYTGTYPDCKQCHSCFQFYDNELRTLGIQMQTLRNASAIDGGQSTVDFGPRIAMCNEELKRIQKLSSGSGVSDNELVRMENQLVKMREDMRKLNPDLPPLDGFETLSNDLGSLGLYYNNIYMLYQGKITQKGNMEAQNASGLYTIVSSAYQSTQESAKSIAAAVAIVSQSREGRRGLNGVEGKIQEALEDLKTLKDELSYPDLTPTINRICEGIRSDSCTPENCPGNICRRNNVTLCKVGTLCRGAFPLSMNALRSSEKTSKDLLDLSNQLMKNAQMINEAEKTANQIKDNAQHLVSQVTQTRKDMEQRIVITKQFIQQVRDFLTEPSTDPATIQEVSEYVLSLKLPVDALSLQRKINEIRSIAEKLPNVEIVLSQTREDIAKAKKLQTDAEDARNKAKAVEDNVDGVVENIKVAKKALQEAEDKIRGSGLSLQQIQDRVLEIGQVLDPVKKGMNDMQDQLQGFTQQLENLRDRTAQSLQQAGQAKRAAEGAHRKALDAQQGLDAVIEKYALVKRRLEQTNNIGAHGQLVARIKKEADDLFKESQDTMTRMKEIESELLKDQQYVIQKTSELNGLESEIRKIRDDISSKANFFSTCRD